MPSALPVESRRPARGHDPVLADEVVRLLAPRPGDTVVDATFGAGGHARRLAPALGQDGRYIAIDQDPEASAWFADLAEDVVCETRFIRANFAEALPRLGRPGRARRRRPDGPRPVVDAGRPARARLLLLAPGAARHAHGPGPRALGRRPGGHGLRARAGGDHPPATARSATRARSRAPSCAAAARRPSPPPASWSRWSRSAVPTPALFAGGHPAKRVFQALRIAVNDELGSLESGLEAAFDLLAPAGGWR